MELLCQPVDLTASVAEDHSLRDRNSLIEVGQRFKLPFFLFNTDIELLDTFQRKLITLDKDANGITHELLRHSQHVLWHRGRKQNDLSVLRQQLEHLVHLVLETTREHFVGFIKTEHLELVRTESATINHIVHTTRRTDNHLGTVTEASHVLTHVSATNAGVALDVHVVTESHHDILDLLSQFTSGGQYKSLNSLKVWVDTLQDSD